MAEAGKAGSIHAPVPEDVLDGTRRDLDEPGRIALARVALLGQVPGRIARFAEDLRTALYVCAAAPLAGLVFTLLLPSTRTRQKLEPEIAVP